MRAEGGSLTIFGNKTTEEARAFAEAAVLELCELQKADLQYKASIASWEEVDGALREGLPAVSAVAERKKLTAVSEVADLGGATDLDKLIAIGELSADSKSLAQSKRDRIAKTVDRVRNALRGAGLEGGSLLERFTQATEKTDWDNLQSKLAQLFTDNRELPARIFENADWPLPLACWEEVRKAEQKEINELRLKRGLEREPDQRWFGLAFSGGGIRSATFNLGVLQGLAGFGLLKKVDILSTVSGGGYIGSWLAAWIKREKIDIVEEGLAASGAPRRDMPAATPVRFLRQFSNYLTPSLGFFSIDSWTVIAVFLRNVALNQVTLAAIIGALMLLPRFAVWPLMQTPGTTTTWAHNWMIELAIALSTASVILVSINLLRVTADVANDDVEKLSPGWWSRTVDFLSSLGNTGVQVACVSLMIAGVSFGSGWFWLNIGNNELLKVENTGFWRWAFGVFFFLSLSITVCCRSFGCVNERLKGIQQKLGWFALVLAMVTSTGAALGLLRGYLAVLAFLHGKTAGGPWHAVAWSPVMLMMVPGTAAILHIGLLGTYVKDVGREWLTRFRASTHLWLFFWVGLCCAAIYGPLLFAKLGLYLSTAVSLGWIISTVAALKAGQSSATGATKDGAPTMSAMDVVAKIGPPAFMVGFLLLISGLEELYLIHSMPRFTSSVKAFVTNYWDGLGAATPDTLFVVLAVVGMILAWRVDINEFSMHHFYKNRLVRCYLGASNVKRAPNPFTGFDPDDDVSLSDFKASKGYTGPYHIVNTTLNLSAGGDLAWQERKGASFILTPGYCGFDLSLETVTEGAKQQEAKLTSRAYRDTRHYAYPQGVPIGTAVAISGAAADPNQGYSTSPTVAFLLTVFDVRLGWWLGNPRRNTESTLPGPRFGLLSLLSELLGRTDDQTNFVSLSDGGHFDNMGLYELIRRRCRYIILCDGEQDGKYTFEGLGTAIRKCRIDFGAQIEIDPRAIIPNAETRRSEAHCAVGTIHYADKTTGTLLYIKSSLTGDEPKDVLQYASTSTTFPHETTADQWFSESQFESYRALGYQAVNAAIAPAKIWAGAGGTSNVEELFQGLRSCWYPANPGMREHAIKHTATLSQLLTRISSDEDLHDLGHKLFSVKGEFGPGGVHSPEEFYFVMVLLQLVEDVYFDFQLEQSHWQEDPRIGGWMKLFEQWASSSIVKQVWESKKETFRKDFQNFWETFERKREEAEKEAAEKKAAGGKTDGEQYVSKAAGAE